MQRIVEAAQVRPGERIVEVGAGLGALTQGLVDAGAKVWALEIDRGFSSFWKSALRAIPKWSFCMRMRSNTPSENWPSNWVL